MGSIFKKDYFSGVILLKIYLFRKTITDSAPPKKRIPENRIDKYLSINNSNKPHNSVIENIRQIEDA